MRQLTIFCIAIILPALAAGQATVISGYAVNWAPPGVYAEPFVPLLSTPSMSFENISPSPVGASNATAGNVAGATNATLSVLPAGPVEQFPPSLLLGSAESSIEAGTEGESRAEASTSTEPRPLELGAASFQDSYGVAQLAAGSRARQQAKRLYSNLDIERMNQMTGMVKYEGKTERLE
ncbi:MAG: hypothetical protein DMG85_13945 [Acidobacteria bacterium]|jgi:hypothetical protein|nr:MAG: hypothetical protein DMG85_13945 [Acidobacteriota bacterium]